jgi:hypothetical protein
MPLRVRMRSIARHPRPRTEQLGHVGCSCVQEAPSRVAFVTLCTCRQQRCRVSAAR